MSGWSFVKQKKAFINGGWYCESCLTPLTQKTAIGHHFPVFRRNGGKDVVENCVIHCVRCEKEFHSEGGQNVSGKRKRHNPSNKKRGRYSLSRLFDKTDCYTKTYQSQNVLLPKMSEFRVPRCYFRTISKTSQRA